MMKKVVVFCLLNGVAWVWCSYILAFMGMPAIAESLSKVAITEIVGVTLVYAVKSLIENISRHNNWPDKPVKVKVPEPGENSHKYEDDSENNGEMSWDNWNDASDDYTPPDNPRI